MVSGGAGRALLSLVLFASAACANERAAESGRAGASASGSAAPVPSASAGKGGAERARALLLAEHRRESRDVLPEDFASRDVNVRRAAARALARIGDARAADLLGKSLSDEDPEVVAWSAYGLGYACKEREEKAVRALVARQATLLAFSSAAQSPDKTASARSGALFDPVTAIADALGRCGGAEAERSLRAWLEAEPALAEAAAFAFGTLAVQRGKLEDASLVALLEAASRREPPLAAALQAFTRLSSLSDPVRARLADVARARLAAPQGRGFAIRAIAAAGESAVPDLEAALLGSSFTPAERADAARALGRSGAAGQNALIRALAKLLEDPAATADAALRSAELGVLTTALSAVKSPLIAPLPALGRLADLPLPDDAALRRRAVMLRCRAAELLAGAGTASPKLAACDPDPKGRAGRLALLAVLDRGPLRGSRLRLFRELCADDQPLVRERALELLAGHPEVSDAAALVARALAEKAPGPVATAARFAADYPQRVSVEAATLAPHPEVSRALAAALERWRASSEVEVRGALLDAAGSLQFLGSKPEAESECASDNPTLRLHAEKALRLLGDRTRRCDTARATAAAPEELARLRTRPATLALETDAGTFELTLDPSLAPVAATRIEELARSGFYDGIVIHRVVPGFVVQLGDPGGDGYGGAPRPPLRCETSPARFSAGAVGIALGGRDTGSSQFFVTLSEQPHLDGAYARIGQAGAGWDRLVEGDIVRKFRVQ